jgi:LuxR family quorum-sensing system transcriptional regulator CciR
LFAVTDIARIQDFVDTSRQVTDQQQLQELLQEVRAELGFDYFWLVHRVDVRVPDEGSDDLNTSKVIALSDYPEEWVDAYITNNMAAEDPVLQASQDAGVGFRWSDIADLVALTPHQRELFEQGRAAGIVDGFTVPAKASGLSNGSCNFAIGPGRDLPRANLLLAELVGIHSLYAARQLVERAHAQVDRPRLTPRQRDCIDLVGRGKTDWEIAQILGISPATVKDHIDDARRKYGVSKRVQIVLRAAFDGHMELASLVR